MKKGLHKKLHQQTLMHFFIGLMKNLLHDSVGMQVRCAATAKRYTCIR